MTTYLGIGHIPLWVVRMSDKPMTEEELKEIHTDSNGRKYVTVIRFDMKKRPTWDEK